MSHTSVFTTRHRSRSLLGVAVVSVSASLLALSLMALDTDAAIGGCRSDPVVTLSNGNTLHLSAVVNDTTTDVQQVSYTLHAPVGTWVMGEVDTSVLGVKDTFQYNDTQNQSPNTYSVAVRVNTGTSQIPVVAATDLVGVSGTVLSTASADGQSPQTLWMNVSG